MREEEEKESRLVGWKTEVALWVVCRRKTREYVKELG